MIASLRPVDELSLIHDRLACGTAIGGRAQQGMASVSPEIVHLDFDDGSARRRVSGPENARLANLDAIDARVYADDKAAAMV